MADWRTSVSRRASSLLFSSLLPFPHPSPRRFRVVLITHHVFKRWKTCSQLPSPRQLPNASSSAETYPDAGPLSRGTFGLPRVWSQGRPLPLRRDKRVLQERGEKGGQGVDNRRCLNENKAVDQFWSYDKNVSLSINCITRAYTVSASGAVETIYILRCNRPKRNAMR